jgi:GNAT superfamily N-acetyltransferase
MRRFFKPLTLDDAEAVHALERLCTNRNAGPLDGLIEFIRHPRTAGAVCVHRELFNPTARIVGYCLFVYEGEKGLLRLTHLAVHPTYRGKGIGREFLSAVETICTRTGLLPTARVQSKNLGAQLFFKACSWRCVSVICDHFPDGDDAFVFHKEREPAALSS